MAATKDALGSPRRTLTVTAGNGKNNHLYVSKLLDILPPDCIGPAKKSSKASGKEIEIELDGLNQVIATDVCVDAKTGRPRFFRRRDWVGPFFEHHQIEAGGIRFVSQPTLTNADEQARAGTLVVP